MPTKTYGRFGKTVTDVEDEKKKPSPKTDETKKSSPKIQNPFNSGLVRQEPPLREVPQLRDENGNLNQRYNTNKGEDMLAGMAMGSQLGRDPFQQLGGAVGGLLGGLVGKNIAGRQRYNQDVEDTNQYNNSVLIKTQASMRAEQMAIQAQKAALDAQVKIAREERLGDVANQKDTTGQLKRMGDYIQTTSGDERKFYQQQHAKMMGIPDWEAVDDDYLVNWKEQKYGDVVYQTTKGGEIKAAVVDGQVINDIGLKEWVDILAKANKMNPEVDAETIKSARDEAIKALEPYRKDFKTAKGQFNPVQYNAQIMSLSSKILETKKSQPDGQLNIPTEININGAPVKISLGVAQTPPTNNTQPIEQSQFMPKDVPPAPPVYDAVAETNAASQKNPDSGFPLSMRATETDPTTKKPVTKDYPAREVEAPNLGGRKVPNGTKIPSKDGSKMLFLMDDKWYEIKLK